MSNLKEKLKELYNAEVKESELELASVNLINFFKLLSKIEQRRASLQLNHKKDENNGSKN